VTNLDPLIARELRELDLGPSSTRDLMPLIVAKVRRRRMRRIATIAAVIFGLLIISGLTYGFIQNAHKNALVAATENTGAIGSHDSSAINSNSITGLISDYPLTWEQSIGALDAISKPAGLGDTLGGLTAVGLKVSWTGCANGAQCPTTWVLSLKNNTQDLVTATPALSLFTDHSPLESSSRPTTVTPGSTTLLVFTFPEFKSSIAVSPSAAWEWNWYLTSSSAK
jgi:hypothetical protein